MFIRKGKSDSEKISNSTRGYQVKIPHVYRENNQCSAEQLEPGEDDIPSEDEGIIGQQQLPKKHRIEELITEKVREIMCQLQPKHTNWDESMTANVSNLSISVIVQVFDREVPDINSQNWINKFEQLTGFDLQLK